MKKLLLFPALLMLTAGCDNPQSKAIPKEGGYTVYIDTLDINGHPHEMLYYSTGGFGRRLMHSPECWCGKEVVR